MVVAHNTMSIQQIDNCFSNELADQLNQLVTLADWRYGWRSNHSTGYGHWNVDFTQAAASNGLDVAHRVQAKELQQAWLHLKLTHFPQATLLRCYANSHTFGVEGYPHTDSLRACDYTAVVYLNKIWRREWGGETMIYKGDRIEHAELPKFNRALVFPGDQWHVAKSPSRICPDLRITLMFKFSLDQDPLRNKIQSFLSNFRADKIKHNNSSLQDHLLRTYDLLKQHGRPDQLAGAGAMHSIFGTGIFKTATLDRANRGLVERVIGIPATDLVMLFSTLDRPNTLVSALTNKTLTLSMIDGTQLAVDQTTLDDLVWIEAMNLQEQGSLSKYPLLEQWLNNKSVYLPHDPALV